MTTAEIDSVYITASRETITAEGLNASAAKVAEPGTLLLAMYGQGKTRGKVAILRIPASMNQACAAIEAGRGVDETYLLHYLTANYSNIRGMSNAGSQDNLSGDIVKSIAVAIPPWAEQRAIAQALTDVDELIGALERLIAKKRDVKQGMMQELLTGRTRLPGISGDWAETVFGDVVRPAGVRVHPKSVSGRVVELEHMESGTGDLRGDSDVSESASLKTRFESGDVLFGKLRPYLRKFWLADRDGYCSTEIWALRPISNEIIGPYLRYVVERDDFIETASAAYGTHMPRADWSVVSKFMVRLPTPHEQHAIAEVLQNADSEIEALERRLESARAVKVGMMQELLTGRTRLPVKEEA
ncbi:type I restriction enzyme S subunit [Arthrobacter sp. AZCC_0090]|nr:type I restriction enzyme S subunit [Arthrobacter sp. AZCC_0090]